MYKKFYATVNEALTEMEEAHSNLPPLTERQELPDTLTLLALLRGSAYLAREAANGHLKGDERSRVGAMAELTRGLAGYLMLCKEDSLVPCQ